MSLATSRTRNGRFTHWTPEQNENFEKVFKAIIDQWRDDIQRTQKREIMVAALKEIIHQEETQYKNLNDKSMQLKEEHH